MFDLQSLKFKVQYSINYLGNSQFEIHWRWQL